MEKRFHISELLSLPQDSIESLPAFSSFMHGIVNVKHEPTPTWDSTVMEPLWDSMMCLTTLRPRPVPPCRRHSDIFPRLNGKNISVSLSLGMPPPVSLTVTTTNSSSTVPLHSITISPSSVNLHALPTRLYMTCTRRWGSPMTKGVMADTLVTNLTPGLKRASVSSITSSISFDRLTCFRCTTSVPRFIAAASSTSLTSANNRIPLFRIAPRLLAFDPCKAPAAISASLSPMIPFSGVRSSCVMTVINSSF
mmetsp:Transcript_12975/g.37278  ORF Transcript_12975/g.37278 Transcript_12975/m.37278 type:complete len:251 (-) Transcript_12975:1047-1799(-)